MGSISEPAGGGGGIGTPSAKKDTETEIADAGYTMTYICKTVKKFLNDTPNYDLSRLVLLQEDIKFEINFVIPFTTLKGYVDSYDIYCLNKSKNTQSNLQFQESLFDFSDRKKDSSINLWSYIKLPFTPINFGRFPDLQNNNTRLLYDFVGIFFPLSVSDQSDLPNITWEWNIRIIPIIGLIAVISLIIYIRKYYKIIDKLSKDE